MDTDIKIKIRNATTGDDIEFIAKRFEETISLWEDYEVTEESVAKRIEIVEKWLTENNVHVTVAVTEDDEIIGFNSLWVFDGYSGEKLGKICILYVLPEHRGQGIAGQLKIEGEKWMRSMGAIAIITEIDAKNMRMLEIAQKVGFEIKSFVLQKKL